MNRIYKLTESLKSHFIQQKTYYKFSLTLFIEVKLVWRDFNRE